MSIDSRNKSFFSMATVMFTLFLTIYELYANQIKYQKIDLENLAQGQGVEKWDLRHSN